MTATLALHTAATLLMVGLIWFVQVVHYPLFSLVGGAQFVAYERGHQQRITALLAGPALIEVITAGLLVGFTPDGVAGWIPLAGGILLAAIWITTALVQVPLHGRLATGFDPTSLRRLVRSNWWRTAAWTLRGILAMTMVVLAA